MKNKKVGIITIFDNENFGNRLQSIALQDFFRKNGYITENLVKKQKQSIIKKVKKYIKLILNYQGFRKKEQKKKLFQNFNKKICFSPYDLKCEKEKIVDSYIAFFVGSDQIWNPNFNSLDEEEFFLSFVSEKAKKNSFSASIGLDLLDSKISEKYAYYLESFNGISVREESAKKILSKIIPEKDIFVLLDPTMLIDESIWENYMNPPKIIPSRRYILNMFLGEISQERNQQILDFAAQYDCEIINLLDLNDKYFVCGPSEFLYFVKHAFLVCTDSFHSCVFSILFKIPFAVFNREGRVTGMNSRIDTLLRRFDFMNQYVIDEKKLDASILNIQYDQIDSILQTEREKASLYIQDCMKEK